MRTMLLVSFVSLSVLVPCAAIGQTHVDAGIRIQDGSVRDFHLAIGQHYGCGDADIVAARRCGCQEDELPVVFFLASHAKVAPHVILEMRSSGRSWMDIGLHFGLAADVYHVEFRESHGPPYGRAYGYYKNHPRSEWASIRLTDTELVHLVNVQFLSVRFGYSPDEVVRLQGRGEGFASLHAKVKAKKGNASAAKAGRGRDSGSPRREGNEPPSRRGRSDSGKQGGGRGKGKKK